MRRAILSLCLLGLAALPARGHFVFLVPDAATGGVRMVFSDSLAPDDNVELLAKIKQSQVFSCDPKGSISPVKFEQVKDAFSLGLEGKTPRIVFATCRYGVFQRGQADPALLTYYAKALVGDTPRNVKDLMATVGEKLALDIVLTDVPGTLKVLWKGKPLTRTKVFVALPGGKDKSEATTDEDGTFKLSDGKPAPGLFALRVGHTVKEAGELDGKKYAATRHWATFVFDARQASPRGNAPEEKSSKAEESPAKGNPKENPAASKLLADARAARANWDDFPGFSADLELNTEGKLLRGKVEVDDKGKVTLHGVEDEKQVHWLQQQLGSIVGHRLSDSTELNTPCAFKDDDKDHPLGRAIQVLSGEFHSSYRIRDRQVIVVNRTMTRANIRFSIVVLENQVNAEKKFLPAHYVVNSWDLKTNALQNSRTFHHEWKRVGKFDLPATSMILTAAVDGKLEARKLTLSNHKLR